MSLARQTNFLPLLLMVALPAQGDPPLAIPPTILESLTHISANANAEQRDLAAAWEHCARSPLSQLASANDWMKHKAEFRAALQEMLGLSPWPLRTPLQPVITRTLVEDDVVVELLHFQSSPGLYVTGNLYRPRHIAGKLPTILYVCGHARVTDPRTGVSFGNKTAYQHHGLWLAQHGFLALLIDTVQLGEIEGEHHGTYSKGRWWWNARGYTPAGVEAWNAIRAIDYLQSRDDTDPARIGMTGRSGGGATTWWTAALDERIQVAAPVAGITSLKNHLVDGCVDQHCDCMYFHNTRHWDFGIVAALVAPRPLLLVNTDRDPIFPLEGVLDIAHELQRVYAWENSQPNFGLSITHGPHHDLPELQLTVLRWLRHHLQHRPVVEPLVELPKSRFQPEQLRVFTDLPSDERVTTVDQWFVPQAAVRPATEALRPQLAMLAASPHIHHNNRGLQLVSSQVHQGREWHVHAGNLASSNYSVVVTAKATINSVPARVALVLADGRQSNWWSRAVPWPHSGDLHVLLPPRYVPEFAAETTTQQTQWRRRLMLLGTTLAAQQTYDVAQFLKSLPEAQPVHLFAPRDLASVALIAALNQTHRVSAVTLVEAPLHWDHTADMLGIAKICPLPTAVELVAQDCAVTIVSQPQETAAWQQALRSMAPATADRIQLATSVKGP